MSQITTFGTGGGGGGTVITITGNTGGPVGPDGFGNINIVGSGNITVAGNAGTFTEVISIVGIIPIIHGGTNASSFSITDGTVYFDGTRLVTTATGTIGQVLTSGGAGVAPSYQTSPASVTSITGNSGPAQTGAINLITANGTPKFVGAAGTITLDFGLTNLILGDPGSITIGTANTGYGLIALAGTTSGSNNTGLGFEAMVNSTTSSNCVSVGAYSMFNTSTGADNNTAIGYGSLGGINTGTNNTTLGSNSGAALTGTDSNNIMIGNIGGAGINATIAIGTSGTQTSTFVAGISGVAVSNLNMVTIDTASGQLGSQAIPASSITITGDTGGPLTSNSFTFDAITQAGSSVSFSGSGTTISLNTTDSNDNTMIGISSGNGSISGTNNCALGNSTGFNLTSGEGNCFFGHAAGVDIQSGSNNIFIGEGAGSPTTTADSSNIYLNHPGVFPLSESNTLRIGHASGTSNLELSSAYIAGIAGVSVSNLNMVTIDTTTGQLGSQAVPSSSISITGDTGGALTSNSFTFTGGTTGLSFGGSGSTETLTFAGITANGGTVSLATDATNSTINIGTGGGIKTTTLGSTNTSSSTIIKSGSGNVVINSGLTIDSTGITTNTTQPCFMATRTADITNVTGDNTVYTIVWDTITYDQNSNFDGVSTFTAPKTGKYQFNVNILALNMTAANTFALLYIKTTANQFITNYINPSLIIGGGGTLVFNGSVVAPMSAGDTAFVELQVFFSTKTVGIQGNTSTGSFVNFFSGYLVC